MAKAGGRPSGKRHPPGCRTLVLLQLALALIIAFSNLQVASLHSSFRGVLQFAAPMRADAPLHSVQGTSPRPIAAKARRTANAMTQHLTLSDRQHTAPHSANSSAASAHALSSLGAEKKQRVLDDVVAFYYPWYGTPTQDGRWLHWDHERLPHWDKKLAHKFTRERHAPPEDIGSSFYPQLGPYSSRDHRVIDNHMRQLVEAEVGTLAVSWYPPGLADNEGRPSDELVPTLLDAARANGLKLCLHVEPYANRTALTVRNDLEHIHSRYGAHPALMRFGPKRLPLVFIYDSYLVPPAEWARVFTADGDQTVRHTPLDAVALGLLVKKADLQALLRTGFDGMYTYFASRKFTFGSEWNNWNTISSFARDHSLVFVPSVGPGYDDTRVRPWNAQNTQDRRRGRYYDDSFGAAIRCRPRLISITSFNEWHEGTQIERAVSHKGYPDYGEQADDAGIYLKLTRGWVQKFRAAQRNEAFDEVARIRERRAKSGVVWEPAVPAA